VVVLNIFARLRTIVGLFVGSAMLMAAGPALANSSASADIAAPLRAAQAARHSVSGAEDEQFSKLFRRWQSFEDSTSTALASVTDASNASNRFGIARKTGSAVSIPSRMPVKGIHLTSGYGMRNHPVTGRRRAHKGIDLAGPTGTPVHASADGIISRADWFSTYGLYVSIEHGGEIQTRYAHMSRLNVAKGQRINKGDVIGFIGSTGRSTGPHLHYEVRISNKAVNPIPYMQAEQATVAVSAPQTGIGGSE
jgi:murein DD-endopeptidase MepM/ murein hydrolase activator NlpD